MSLDAAQFEADCRQSGFADVEHRDGAPDFKAQPHTHPFDVRGYIVAGEFTLVRNDKPERYVAGQSFEMEAGCLHAEHFGAAGSKYILGRRHYPPKSN